MGLLDRVKASAEQAASSAQKQAQIVATKRELSQAYGDLGKTAFSLADRGELTHGDLAAGVDHIRELQARLSGDGASASAHDAGDAGDTGGTHDGADIVE